MKSLKAAYKAASGSEWSPTAAAPQKAAPTVVDVTVLNSQIKSAGDKVRDLKTNKAEKVYGLFFIRQMQMYIQIVLFFSFQQAVIDAAVKELLALKAEFKSVSGKDWSPNAVPAAAAAPPATEKSSSGTDVNTLNSQIKAAGDKVRDLKARKAEKVCQRKLSSIRLSSDKNQFVISRIIILSTRL